MKTKGMRAGSVCSKRIAVCLSVLMLGVSLGGCGQEDKVLELRVVTLSAYQQQVTEAAEYFMEKHEGSRIKVEMLSDVKETRSSEIQKLKTETMAGKGADVFILEGEDPRYAEDSRQETLFPSIGKTMESGVFASLDSYMEEDSYWEESTYKKEFLTAGQYDGRQYIIPMSCSYDVFVSATEDERMTGTTLEEWVMQAEASEDIALCRTVAGYAGLMGGSLAQPAVDYQSKKVLFDAKGWRQFYEKLVPIRQKGYTSDFEGTEASMMGRIDNIICDSVGMESSSTFQAAPTIDGKKLAMIKGYGAVGMTCENKKMAYEFLMLLLNGETAKEKGAEHTSLQGMLGMDGVPVQESAWQYISAVSGAGNEKVRGEVLASFHELEGAYFATPVETMLTDAAMEILLYAEATSEEELSQNFGRTAQQAKEQYEAMVKE